MYQEDECPCCGSTDRLRYPAIVAPFIAAYVLASPTRVTYLAECRSCTFRFFEERYDDDEVRRLYEGYRGEKYLQERHAFEFWYTRKINDTIGRDSNEIRTRQERILNVLRGRAPLPLESVLDYGGDRGQFIPDGIAERRFVFDISGAKPEPNVVSIASTAAVQGKSFELVMLAHVLEHLSSPAPLVREVRSYMQKGGYLYVEVPYERYNLHVPASADGRMSSYERYLRWLIQSPRGTRAADFVSTALRVKTNRVVPFGFVKLHEHINFFNEASLRILLEGAGLSLVACELSPDAGPSGFRNALSCLARTAT
jgi:hypothetical protein